jgi:hypothetical protein
MTELAKRAVACSAWRWLPGMWIVDEVGGRGVVLDIVTQGGQPCVKFQNPAHTRQGQAPAAWCVPDLNDPATLGCLLALVREAWDDPFALVDYDRCNWGLFTRKHDCVWVCTADTEAEALVAALEAAP